MTQKILQEIVHIIKLISGDLIQKVFLFGSRVNKKNLNPNADIDIGILASRKLSFTELDQINQNIEKLDTLLKIDIVDFTQREDDFTKEALQHVEVLYEKR